MRDSRSSDDSILSREHGRRAVVGESRLDDERRRVSLLVLGRLSVLSDSVTLSDAGAGELDTVDVLVLGKLDDDVGRKVDSGSGSREVVDPVNSEESVSWSTCARKEGAETHMTGSAEPSATSMKKS